MEILKGRIKADKKLLVADNMQLTDKDAKAFWPIAHIDGVESELIVRSSHSTQGTPETIEEVRRILYQHLDQW